MRVLHLTVEYPPIIHGGLGTAVGGLVHASADAGLDVAVLLVGHTGHVGYGPWGDSQSDDVPFGIAGQPPVLSVSWEQAVDVGARLAAAWRPDVLHLHPFWLWPVARAIRDRVGTPIVYTVHSLDRAEYEIGHGPPECLTQWDLQAESIAGADRVIALTHSERHLIEQYCTDSTGSVRVVGNGIADEPRQERQRPSEAPVVLFSGRFVDRKGVRELLAAIPEVLAAAPKTRFVLAGGHRHCTSEEMTRWWLPAELESHRASVHFTGWLTPDELGDWYSAADILVVPSWYEPFGMVVLEGMLHGLAVAAANVGGPAEILDHDRTGLLFPARDAAALGDSIVRLARDHGLRRRLGGAAAAHVREHWLWPKIIVKVRRVYHEAELAYHRTRAASLPTERLAYAGLPWPVEGQR
jgi:glycogen synthase